MDCVKLIRSVVGHSCSLDKKRWGKFTEATFAISPDYIDKLSLKIATANVLNPIWGELH
jgi:hypothetical protein